MRKRATSSATGLRFCTTTLRSSVPYIYDFTIGYKGVQAGQIPSTVFKLRSIFLDGKGPPEVHMHIRKIPLKDVPTDEKGFTEWITKVYVHTACASDRQGHGYVMRGRSRDNVRSGPWRPQICGKGRAAGQVLQRRVVCAGSQHLPRQASEAHGGARDLGRPRHPDRPWLVRLQPRRQLPLVTPRHVRA